MAAKVKKNGMEIPGKLTRVRLDKLNFREYSVRIESAIEIKNRPGLDLTSKKINQNRGP